MFLKHATYTFPILAWSPLNNEAFYAARDHVYRLIKIRSKLPTILLNCAIIIGAESENVTDGESNLTPNSRIALTAAAIWRVVTQTSVVFFLTVSHPSYKPLRADPYEDAP
jgi:hypothetical protein